MIPRATYRLQFHKGFGFADAEALVPYLDTLGISHIYASPITVAVPGSTHGYDVVDPTRINPELGGEAAFRSLVAALRARGMGVIIDIVPNHMGVATNENLWWNDVLAHGEASQFARFFDIDWRERLILPILGTPLGEALADGAIALDTSGDEPMLTVYSERRLPLRPEDHARAAETDLAALLERQHYRLAWWRTADDTLNWRRFFTISDLAGLRVEDPAVFEATHELYFRLYREGLIDGVRVDHVDGLTDPAGYCRTLRARLDALPRPADAPPGPAYIVIEKILATDEPLAADWGVDGTSGYDFMADATALLHDPAGEAPLTDLWRDVTGATDDFAEIELRARQQMLAWSFEGQLAACVAAFRALATSAPETAALTRGMLRRAIERALWVFPVYRTYGTGTAAPDSDAEIREQVRRDAARYTPPGEAFVLDHLLAWLAGEGPGNAALAAEAVRRFQQLSAPIAAKAVEDTAFYRDARLLSLLDVGSDATRFALSPDRFLAKVAARAADFPHAMLTTATHDHKRGEDVRARLAVLTGMPDMWRESVAAWEGALDGEAHGVDPADRYALYQTIFGAFPPDAAHDDAAAGAFADRIVGWQQKALREGKQRSSWAAPDEACEARCAALARRLLDRSRSPAFLDTLADLLDRTAAAAQINTLAQTALRCLLPGVPDLYQGAELLDLSLVDPDNRRPVDFAERQRRLAGGGKDEISDAKLRLIHTLLDLRRSAPDLFAQGSFKPARVSGPRADRIVGFSRRHGDRALRCAIVVRSAGVGAEDWRDTTIDFDGDQRSATDLFATASVFTELA
jgi:(1->4)-alpha-D-glucan 1-alpha-D-glucosylmutase